MGKIRVYQLAKELQLDNKELLKKIGELGIEVKSHMSVVDEESAKAITASVKEPPSPRAKSVKKAKKPAAPAGKKTSAGKAAARKEPAKKETAKKATPKKEITKKRPAVKRRKRNRLQPKRNRRRGQRKPQRPRRPGREEGAGEKACGSETGRRPKKKGSGGEPAEKTGKEPVKEPEAAPESTPPIPVVQLSARGFSSRELAERLGVKVNDIIKKFIQEGKDGRRQPVSRLRDRPSPWPRKWAMSSSSKFPSRKRGSPNREARTWFPGPPW